MVDISNRTLALLLVAAVVVSLGSTVVSLNKLETMSITGFATQEATTNLTIAGAIAIRFEDATVSFGSGFSEDDGTGTSCDMATDGDHNTTGFCREFTTNPAPFRLKNIGNIDVNVNISANATAAQFITGVEDGGPAFQFKSRTIGTGCGGGLQSTYQELTGPGDSFLACNDFQWSGDDEMYIDLRVVVPSDANIGTRTATITASAYE